MGKATGSGRGAPASAALAAVLIAAAAAPSCGAPDAREFFKGQAVTIIVPHGKGGLYTNARTLAPYLQKELPGATVFVETVEGEKSLRGRNQVYAAPPDGLTLGFSTIGGTLMAEWAGQPGVRYRTADFGLIGGINANAHILVASPRSGIKSMADVERSRAVRMGFSGVGSDDYYVAMITAAVMGFGIDARVSYASVSDAGLACVKGEVDAILFAESSLMGQVEAGTLVPIAVFGPGRLPALPGVPTIQELLPGDEAELVRSISGIYQLDRILFAPPGLPPERLAALRAAMDAAVADPDFASAMAKVGQPVNYFSGPRAEALLEEVEARRAELEPMARAIARDSGG